SDRKKDEFWARGENQVPIADFIFQQFDRGYVSSGTYTKFIADHYVIRVPISPQWRRQYLYLHELSAKVPGPNRDGLIDI
ncbi:MAG: hypothetical protein GWN00_18795, partial [Aliifodinibius sp.]|nr:hypothetical protein [Phycisphaerae bacterium]NIR64900.1 hypothetical protein [candidate division Zixibacteria bacterium]NIT58197.1 hypothetical protein [Fodinibius sp.]NIU14835.1 hypothetical protein [candidate division Zixibacteria bacterium]NIX02154.1 hypothetical protein [Phycisphaerae bacterium]